MDNANETAARYVYSQLNTVDKEQWNSDDWWDDISLVLTSEPDTDVDAVLARVSELIAEEG